MKGDVFVASFRCTHTYVCVCGASGRIRIEQCTRHRPTSPKWDFAHVGVVCKSPATGLNSQPSSIAHASPRAGPQDLYVYTSNDRRSAREYATHWCHPSPLSAPLPVLMPFEDLKASPRLRSIPYTRNWPLRKVAPWDHEH